MKYRTPNKNDSVEISKLSSKEMGWSSHQDHLEDVLDKYPASIALEENEICGFIYSQALSSDILRICNFVVDGDSRQQGVGSELLQELEEQARESGYKAILFPEDPSWFSKKSLEWLENKGYKDIYKTDQSSLVIKETTERALAA